MVKINVEADCENSPKKEFIRDFEVAFPEKKRTVILDSIDDNISWEMVGESVINGKADAEEMLDTMLDGTITELTIENIITHGDAGSANGTISFEDGRVFSFCDIFNFTSHGKNAKIKKLTSYVIEINKE
jgi:hypothetical protein